MSNPTTIQPGKVFNVNEVTGKEHSALETTAAQAQIEATNKVDAMHISETAEKTQHVADQAASVAKTLGSDFTGEQTTAAGEFKGEASKVTDAAVAEGKHDVDQAKAVGVTYVDQAKALASSAVETAQAYLPGALGGKAASPAVTDPNAPPLTTQLKDAAVTAYSTTAANVVPAANAAVGTAVAVAGATQPYLQSAAGVVQSGLSSASQAAQPHIETAVASAQNALGMTSVPKEPSNKDQIPATSAPLESGPHTITTPYPSTTTEPLVAPQIAANSVPTRN